MRICNVSFNPCIGDWVRKGPRGASPVLVSTEVKVKFESFVKAVCQSMAFSNFIAKFSKDDVVCHTSDLWITEIL